MGLLPRQPTLTERITGAGVSDGSPLDCAEHEFTYRIGSGDCPDCPAAGLRVMTNREHAERQVLKAKTLAAQRRACLVASAALTGTRTIRGARKSLASETDALPPAVIADALAILDALRPGEHHDRANTGRTSDTF